MTAPLFHRYTPATGRTTKVVEDSETGLPLIVKRQDTTPIVDSAKRIASSFDPIRPRSGSDEWTHVARIPVVVWEHLNKLGITSDRRAFDAWLDMRECQAFRTDDGRRLA